MGLSFWNGDNKLTYLIVNRIHWVRSRRDGSNPQESDYTNIAAQRQLHDCTLSTQRERKIKRTTNWIIPRVLRSTVALLIIVGIHNYTMKGLLTDTDF